MSNFDDIGDLYNLNDTNTKLYKEHQEWYDKYKAASIGSLLDNMQSIIERYERAMDNSSSELATTEDELKATEEELEGERCKNTAKDNVIDILNCQITELNKELEAYRFKQR